jgi:N-acyl-D-aspartate/D-glutamate deacylase
MEASLSALQLAIRGGEVIDGSGGQRVRADVGVRDGRIVAVGDDVGGAEQTLDATGLVVAPGFIDVHTHYDAQVFWDPMVTPSSEHGVTTVLGGNCGFSIAPLNGEREDGEYLMRMLSRVEGIPLESLESGVPWNWTSFGSYLSALDGKLAINAGFLVGHSALRRHVMGARALGEAASADDLHQMGALLRQSLSEGGLGFSTTMSRTHNDAEGRPVPSRSASDDELVSLARVVGEFEGAWLEMVSDVGTPFSEANLERMASMSKAAGRTLNWNVLSPDSRHKDVFESQLAASDYAARRGAKVIALAAPQPIKVVLSFAAGMIIDSFAGWEEVMALPLPERKARLADPDVRRQLNASMHADASMRGELGDWSRWTIVETFAAANKALEGQSIGALASRLGKAPLDTLLDLVIEEDLRTLVSPPVSGTDNESWRMRGAAWRDPRAIIGASDAGAHLDMIDTFAFSTQVLSEGVRERNLLGLEEAVHRLTDVPARVFGLRDRGLIANGYWADLVVFDPQTVGCGPLYTRRDLPRGAARLYCDAVGIQHVVVNGREIIRHGRPTGALAGKVLRSGRDTRTVANAAA